MSRAPSQVSSRHVSPVRSDRGLSREGAPRSPASEQMPNIAAIALADPSPTKLTKRPGFGALGKRTKARANFFMLDLSKCKTITSYAAEHQEKGSRRETSGRVTRRSDSLVLARPMFQHAASDYVKRFLTQEGHVLIKPGENRWIHSVEYYEAEETGPRTGSCALEVSIVLQKNGEFRMLPLQTYLSSTTNLHFPQIDDYVAVFNILLDRAISENVGLATYARRTRFFDIRSNNGRARLGNGLEAYKGYFKSVRVCIGGLMLNINTSACAMFRQGRLDTVIGEMAVRGPLINAMLKGARVSTRYSGSEEHRTIAGIAPPTNEARPPVADNVTIKCPQHGIETVAEHFSKTWPTIARPNPLALVVDFGNKTSEMIKFACRKPKQNSQFIINDGMQYSRFSAAGGPTDRFGIALASSQPRMVEIDARRLPSPSIAFAGGKGEQFRDGAFNLRSKRFAKPAAGPSIKISYMELHRPGTPVCENINELLKGLDAGIRAYTGSTATVQRSVNGFTHSQVLPQGLSPNALAADIFREAFRTLLKQGIRLLVVVLPDKDVKTYYAVKKAGGLLTDIGFIANIMLKVNQKLGGVSWALRPDPLYKNLLGDNAMIIGADVTHPGPSAMTAAPSIAAVVASYEDTYFHYPGSTRLQATKDDDKKSIEMILDLYMMMVERLNLYKSKNGRLPSTLLYIRDGVGDGQFAQVVDEEVPQIKRACKQLYENNPLPKLLVVTTQKRHHTRFFQDEGKTGGDDLFDRNDDPLPGFTVDTQITSKHHFDWYNTSHATIQGTSRPGKYVVLFDTIGVSADQVQLMMYHMCFTFGRATRSIGIHPAARYADLLCDRARLYFRDVYTPPPTPQGQDKPVYKVADGHWPGRLGGKALHETMFYI